ncbi:type IV pilin protein [Acinetobacter defluvii]|uniref:type IV pilin protein n=1 Tax=Acinetobacter defluvii TaxID=1871111 RepID=UPI003AF8098A
MKKKLIYSQGFTLIELMAVVVIVAIFAAIAIPAYQSYVRRAVAAQAQQEIQRIATLLEKHKFRNFNYLNFQTTPSPVVIPVGAVGAAIKYTISVKDGTNTSLDLTNTAAAGQSWVIQAITTDAGNDSFVITSTGLRCKKQGSTISLDCTGADPWK